MQTSRRELFLRSLPPMLACPSVLPAQSGRIDWDRRYSQAVGAAVTRTFSESLVRARSRQLTASDLRAMAVSAGLFVDHLSEIGALDDVAQDIRRRRLLDYPAQPQDVQKLHRQLRAVAAVSEQELWEVFRPGVRRNQELLLRMLDTRGPHATLQQLVEALRALSERMERERRPVLIGSAARMPWRPVDFLDDFCFYVDFISLYIGVMALACPALAVPLGVVAATIAAIGLIVC